MSPMIPRYFVDVLAIMTMLVTLSLSMPKALAIEPSAQDRSADGQTTRIHLASNTFALNSGEEKIIPLVAGPDVTPKYIVGSAIVEGGMVTIGLTDAKGSSLSEDGITMIAIYPKDYPWAFYEGEAKDVVIPIRPGMEQLVFSAPSPQAATITFNFDIIAENKTK